MRLNAAGAFAAGLLTAVLLGGASSTILAQGSADHGAGTTGAQGGCGTHTSMMGRQGQESMQGQGMMGDQGMMGPKGMMGSQDTMGPGATMGVEGMMAGQGTMTCQGAMTCAGTMNGQPMASPGAGSEGMGGTMGGPGPSPAPTSTASGVPGSSGHDAHHPSASPAA